MSSSAQSLFSILSELQSIRDKNRQTTVKVIFYSVAKTPFGEESTFTKFTKLCQLVRDTRVEVETLLPGTPYLISWLPSLERNLMNIKMDVQAAGGLGWLREEVINGAQTCATLVDRELSREPINKDDLKRFHDEASSLFQEVKNSDINDELKKFLLKHLKNFLNAIQDSWIMGIEPIKSAAESAFADASFSPSIVGEAQKTPLGKRFLHLLVGLTIITAPVSDIVVIIQALGVEGDLAQPIGLEVEKSLKDAKALEDPVPDATFRDIDKVEE